MSTLIHFADSVTAGNLPVSEKYGVYYADGEYANEAAVRERLPHAKLFGITVEGKTGKGYNFADCEAGDLTPARTVAWVEEQIKLGVEELGVYASLDTWASDGLYDSLAGYGDRIKRWVADYDGGNQSLTITYGSPPKVYGFVARQYAGGMTPTDSDVSDETFWAPFKAKPKPKPKKNTGATHFTGSVDLATGKPHIHHVLSPKARYEKAETKVFTLTLEIKPGEHAHYSIKEN